MSLYLRNCLGLELQNVMNINLESMREKEVVFCVEILHPYLPV
jgi:hypothetical protein